MPVDSDSLGSYLRQERERQRVSLQDIAAATKIQLKFLEALENDAYDQLPASPFVVGFLRAYAQYIALDPEMVLTAYRSLSRAPELPEVPRRPMHGASASADTGAAPAPATGHLISGHLSGGVWADHGPGGARTATRSSGASYRGVFSRGVARAGGGCCQVSRHPLRLSCHVHEPSGAAPAGVATPPAASPPRQGQAR